MFPETKPDLYFDDNGICDACHSAERKHGFLNAINWDKKAEQFEGLVENAKQLKKRNIRLYRASKWWKG